MRMNLLVVQITSAIILASGGSATAQVAGLVTQGQGATEMTSIAHGWSARKDILGKKVYSDSGERVGMVKDLIITPDKNLSYLIISAGGFIGIGKLDIAVPSSQVRQINGRLVFAGASKESVKAMPQFSYLTDTNRYNEFVAAADQQIQAAKDKMAILEASAQSASGSAKEKLDQQVSDAKQSLKTAEDKLTEIKHAGAKKWQTFEAEISKAMDHLKKSIE